jgi:hypothetical protein
VHAKKLLKAEYWTKREGNMHRVAFGKCLNDKQISIERFRINISNKDKLQFYLEQMYSCNQFNQSQMTAWENKVKAIKTNWTEAKWYFEGLVCDLKVYKQNSGGTVEKSKCKSANHAAEADKGNKLRHYIATIADKMQDKMAANICNSMQKKTNKMGVQQEILSNAVAKLTKALTNKENNGGGNGCGSGGGKKLWTKLQCMGGYCWSHGYHPIGNSHTSATCTFLKEGHKTNTTFDNIMGSNDYWPPIHCIINSQKLHSTFTKGTGA